MEIKVKHLVWFFVGAFCFFLLYKFTSNTFSPNPVSYSHFVTQLSSNRVKDIEILEDGRTIVFSTSDSSKEYSVVSPVDTSSLLPTMIENNVRVYAQPPKSEGGISFWTMLLISVVPVFLLIGAMVYLSKRKDGMMAFGESKIKKLDPENNTVSMDDVIASEGGLNEVKDIIDYLKNKQKYVDAGAKFPKGILMEGLPGTGKTMMAKAIAKEANVPFFYASGSEFVEMFVGVGASRVRDMFKQAKEHSLAIIFIDEIDALGKARNSGHGSQEHDQTLNQLLVEMDGIGTNSNILMIGATNRADMLDPALLRPGRFDRTVFVDLPDADARRKILEVHSKDVNLSEEAKEHLESIAKNTSGYSGAELANLINESAMLAAKGDRTIISKEDIAVALDKVAFGAEAHKLMSEEELSLTAYHEAGHAIVGHFSPEHDSVFKISIVPRGQALGLTAFSPDENQRSFNKTKLVGMITTLMAGRAAEELAFGKNSVTSGARSDIARATDLAKSMITEWGFSKLGIANFSEQYGNRCSEETKREIDIEILQLINDCYDKARHILKENREKLDNVAAALIEHETIDLEHFEEIMGDKNVVGA